MYVYIYFIILSIEFAQVVEILPCGREEPSCIVSTIVDDDLA